MSSRESTGVSLIFRTRPHGREERAVSRGGRSSVAQTAPFLRNRIVAQYLVLSFLQLSRIVNLVLPD